MNKKQKQHEITNNSIISTPKPTASSTVEKKHIPSFIDKKFVPTTINYSLVSEDERNSIESLGILSLKDCDLTDQLEKSCEKISSRENDLVENETFSRLTKQRSLAQKILSKVKCGLPSKFLVPSESYESTTALENHPKFESTINETDLLKDSTPLPSFNPNDISTPRNSNAAEIGKSNVSLFEDMSHISEKIRSSNISLKELCSQFSKFSIGSEYKQQNMSEINSQMFEPAEFVQQKLLDDELSWRRKYEIPINTDDSRKESSTFSTSTISDIDRCSVGNFFRQKNNEVLDRNFFKTSPERKNPVPLIDLTNTLQESHKESSAILDDSQSTSILTVSHIAKILRSADSPDSPTKFVNHLLQKNSKSENAKISFSKDIARTEDYVVQEKPETTNILKKSCDEDLSSNKSLEDCSLDSSSEKQDCMDVPKKRLGKNSTDENKENFTEMIDHSITSIRTTSSLSTLPEGKFPIKSTRTELAWGCVKLCRSNMQEFFIRNQLNQRIRMYASITGLCFRILKDRADSDVLTAITFLLHPMETKSFCVSFCPTNLGGFCEKLQFYPIINGEILKNKKQTLALYGYGGHVLLDIASIMRDSNGKLWMSLGKVHHKTVVIRKFNIKNTGTLNAFVCIDIHPKGLYAFSVLYVKPRQIVLKPNEEAMVTITFTPAKKDFLNLVASEVIEIGLLKIIYGAEPLRGRLRRLCIKLKQKGEIPDPILEELTSPFPDETMPSDLRVFKESVGVTKELLQQLIVKEIIMTMEQDLENTLIGHIDIDETSIYQTLGPNISNFSIMENETMKEENKCQFKVEPSSVLLSPPSKIEDIIVIHSENVNPMHFEATVEPTGVFQIHPSMGTISSKGVVFLKINYLSTKPIDKGKVSIFVENDVVEINVKCIFIKQLH